jgi:hypothetical protein
MAAPCLDCGTPTGRKPARCRACASVRNCERNQRRVHYQGDYKARARKVRADANADSSTLCIRCSRPARDGDPWTAGHVVPGDPMPRQLHEQSVRDDAATHDTYAVTATSPYLERAELLGPLDARASGSGHHRHLSQIRGYRWARDC